MEEELKKISELEPVDQLYTGCCMPIVQNGETKKVTYDVFKEQLHDDLGIDDINETVSDVEERMETLEDSEFEQNEHIRDLIAGYRTKTADIKALQEENKELYNQIPNGTATGNPIYINDSSDLKIKSLTEDGKCEQDGTPTPSSKVEIETIRGRNLWHNDVTFPFTSAQGVTVDYDETTGVYTLNGTASATEYIRIFTGEFADFKSGDTITLTTEILSGSISKSFDIGGYNSSDGTNSWVGHNSIPAGTTYKRDTTTLTRDGMTYAMFWVSTAGTVFDNVKLRVQLEKGNGSDYVPYDNLALKVEGKNLLKLTNCETSQFKIEDNIVTSLTTSSNLHYTNFLYADGILYRGSANYDPLEALTRERMYCKLQSGTYILSFTSETDIDRQITIYAIDEDYIGNAYTSIPAANKKSIYVKNGSFTLDHEMCVFVLFNIKNVIINCSNIQLEEGSSATTYEAYKSQTTLIDLDGNELCKIGDVKDELVISETGEVSIIKRIGKVVFDGSSDENWNISYSGTENFYYRYRYISDRKATQSTATSDMCNRSTYANISSTSTNEGFLVLNTNELRIRFGTEMSIADFKTWLSTHNTTVYYILATPTEIDLGSVTQPKTYKNISHITGDNTMSVTYKKDLETLFNNLATALVALGGE